MPSFQKIIDILSNAFSILDFSYIVSGGFTLGIVLFDLHYHYYEFFIRNISITIVCGIFLAYICGLSSWIIGRGLCGISAIRLPAFQIVSWRQQIYSQPYACFGICGLA